MFQPNYYLALRLMEMRVEEELRRSKIRRLLREAGVDERGWLSRQGGRLLCQMGRLLVAIGQRLERYGLPKAFPLEGEMPAGR